MPGLLSTQVNELRTRYGYNEINYRDPWEKLKILLKQLRSPMVYILLAASLISLFSEELIEFVIILSVLVLNTLIGYVQELRSLSQSRQLSSLLSTNVAVYRDGAITNLPARELLPGDVILLQEGDRIPADGVIRTGQLQLNESSVTGESLSIGKSAEEKILSGTYVAKGTGTAEITATGPETFVGKLSRDLVVRDTTGDHFHRKISRLTYLISGVAIVLFGLVLTLAWVRGESLSQALLYAISILVSGIPEGLPALITLALTAASLRIAREKAIVKKLEASEAIGEITTIITDKTGTLTKNVMSVKEVYGLATGRLVDFQELDPTQQTKLLLACRFANTIPEETLRTGTFDSSVLDPTETALYEFSRAKQLDLGEYTQTDYHPFDSGKQYQQIHLAGPQTISIRVGAPEAILAHTKQTGTNTQTILEEIIQKGGRSLAISSVTNDQVSTLLGVVHIGDELRGNVRDTLQAANNLRVRVIMATGDHPHTAVYFAGASGIPGETAMTGREFLTLDTQARQEVARTQNIFARMTPEAKKQLCLTLQSLGENVGMTGDGVNDAPVLKFADVGVAMGQGGTEIAKEASDIILASDDLSVLIGAIRQGRILFQNIYNGITYLVSTNLGELASFFLTLVLGLPAPLTATQILFQNLITDGVNGLALTQNDTLDNPRFEDPIPASQGFVDKFNLRFLLSNTLLIGLGTLAITYVHQDNQLYLQSLVFLFLALTQIVNLYTCKNLGARVLNASLFDNQYLNGAFLLSLAITLTLVFSPLRHLFELTIPNPTDLSIIAVAALGVFACNELLKPKKIASE